MIIIQGKAIKNWECLYEMCKALCCKMERSITPADIDKIVKTTGKALEDFVEISVRKGTPIPFTLKNVDGKCVFLLPNYKCMLHDLEAKPILCRMYPFLLGGIVYGDEPIMKINPVSDCPGYGKGPKLGDDAIRKIAANARAYINEIRKMMRCKRLGMGPEEILEKSKQR